MACERHQDYRRRPGVFKEGFYTGNGIDCPLGEVDDHRLLGDHAGKQLVEVGTLLLAFFGVIRRQADPGG